MLFRSFDDFLSIRQISCAVFCLFTRVLLGFSWLSFTGFQTEFSAVKQNSNSVVFKDTEATRRGFDRLNPAVESFSDSVTDRRSKLRQDSVKAILQHPCDLLDGIEPAADCP